MGLLDTILGGITTVGVSAGSNNLNAAQLANGTITVTGAPASTASINFPAGLQGWWSVQNLITNTAVLLIAAGSGTEVIGAPPGEIIDIQVNGNTVRYRNLARIGSFLDYIGTSIPGWISASTVPPYLNCDGSSFSAGTYPYLNAILGGTTLPDLRGRSRAFLNAGTNRITTAGSGINGDVNLSGGGQQNIALATNMLPPYTPSGTITNGAIIQNVPLLASAGGANVGGGLVIAITVAGGGALSQAASTFTGNAQGGTSTPVTNMPPVAICGFALIRAG